MSKQVVDLPYWEEFKKKLEGRLVVGAREYGDSSFKKRLPRTLQEIEEELLDVCGWSWLAYVRLRRLNLAAKRAERAPKKRGRKRA